jgi:hypothetical protein
VVWNNQNLATAASLYIDIFGVQQPKAANITGTSYISITVDLDTDYSNGATYYSQILDSAPTTMSSDVITINSATLSSRFIRTAQTITIGFSTSSSKFAVSKNLYLYMPASYATWIQRGSTLAVGSACSLTVNGTSTNIATACSYISQRVLKIGAGSTAATNFILTLTGVMSTPFLPTDLYNQIRFEIFLSTSSLESDMISYTYQDRSSSLSLM